MTVTRAVILAVTLWLLPGIVHAEKFVNAWSAVSALDSPFWVMNDAGFLKQEGLDMELVYIGSSPTIDAVIRMLIEHNKQLVFT